MRYHLRTLMVLLAVLPPLLAGVWFAFQPIWLGLMRPDDIHINGIPWASYGDGAKSVQTYSQPSPDVQQVP